jgi:outer membrane usher protein FimD/PapC
VAVRVSIQVQLGRKSVRAVAVANSGYEAGKPELLVPLFFATHQLGLKFENARPVSYTAAGGQPLRLFLVGNGRVSVVVHDRRTKSVKVNILASKGETELVMNDSLLEALGISLLKVKRGEWRLEDDPAETRRQSELPAQY